MVARPKPHSRSYSGYFVGAAAIGVSLARTLTKRRAASDAGICGVDDGGSLPRSALIVEFSALMSERQRRLPGRKVVPDRVGVGRLVDARGLQRRGPGHVVAEQHGEADAAPAVGRRSAPAPCRCSDTARAVRCRSCARWCRSPRASRASSSPRRGCAARRGPRCRCRSRAASRATTSPAWRSPPGWSARPRRWRRRRSCPSRSASWSRPPRSDRRRSPRRHRL